MAQAVTGKRWRVAICLGPSDAPDPIGPARKWYAKEFATHGLADGRDIEIAIVRAKSVVEIQDQVESIRGALAIGAHVILTHAGGPYAKEFILPLTRGIPLILWGADDGTEDSIESLNRRGENVTGAMYSYIELVTKRFALLKELRPGSKRVAIVFPKPAAPPTRGQEQGKRLAYETYARNAGALGLEFVPIEIPTEAPAETAIAELRKARVDMAECLWALGRVPWEQLAANGIAASGLGAWSAKNGALLGGWSVGFIETAVRLAARVVRGQPASAIPVERVREFGLAINLATARKLGIAVPPSVMVGVHEVFE